MGVLKLPRQERPSETAPRHRHATQAVDEEGDTDEESSKEGDVSGVERECGLNDEDDGILGMGWGSTDQIKWERVAGVVDSNAAENVLLADVRSCVKLSATCRSEAGIGFRAAGGERIRNHGQRKLKVRMPDGHMAGSTWQVADLKKPLMSVAEMVVPGNRVQEAGFSPADLRPEVCVTDEGQTIILVRSECVPRRRKVVRGVEDGQQKVDSDQMQWRSLRNWQTKTIERRTETVQERTGPGRAVQRRAVNTPCPDHIGSQPRKRQRKTWFFCKREHEKHFSQK